MKTLIIGSSGQLGQTLIKTKPIDTEIIQCSRDELDLSIPKNIYNYILGINPDCIINSAAYTNVDQAEKEGINIDHIQLSKELGVSVFKTNARKPDNLDELIQGIRLNSTPCGRLIDLKPFHLNDLLDAYNWAEGVLSKCKQTTQKPKGAYLAYHRHIQEMKKRRRRKKNE